MSNAEAEPQLSLSIEAIAAACAWLQARGVQVCLHLCSEPGGQLAPSPKAIRVLAPFLSSIDYHSVPDLLATTSPFVHGSQACFTDAQVEALPPASQSLQTLCISEHVYSHTSPASFQAQIPSIAALSNLTKLHVTFRGQPDFGPLAQLTKIEDLALQCSGHSSDCSHIIHSNRFGLQSLTIASRSWTDSTYAAAANVETLLTAVIKVEILTEAGAALVANLVHPGSVQVLIGCCHQMPQRAFLLLSSGQAKITILELWEIDANQCSRLQTMPSLHEMTLIKPQLIAPHMIFTALQPQLTDLRLISCLQLTHNAMANIVQSLPALQRFAFQQESHTQPLAGIRSLMSAGLLMLNQASNLRVVNLEGAQGLSDEMIYAFEADFRAEHKSEAGRCLALQLPSRSGTRNTLHHTFQLHFPVSWCQAAKQHKPYWVCLSSPAKPGWDAHLSKRRDPSRAVMRMRICEERLNKTVAGILKCGFAVMCTYIVMRRRQQDAESSVEYWKGVCEGQNFETAKFLQPLYDNPDLNFGEHVDQYLANLERERG